MGSGAGGARQRCATGGVGGVGVVREWGGGVRVGSGVVRVGQQGRVP